MGDRLPVDAALRAFVPTRRPYVMADRFTVDAAVAALLPPEEAKRLGGDFVPESTNAPSARDELQRQCDDFNAIWPVGQRVP